MTLVSLLMNRFEIVSCALVAAWRLLLPKACQLFSLEARRAIIPMIDILTAVAIDLDMTNF